MLKMQTNTLPANPSKIRKTPKVPRASRARHDAFAGSWTVPTGKQFTVYFVDRAESRSLMRQRGKIRNTGHPDYIPVGWRWRQTGFTEMHGPYSSSRDAYRDAMDALGSTRR